jgi:16S rRNA (uracil1498-N3)-methyltransferase
MEIRRFFVDKKDIVDGKITLTGDEFYHMTKVLRYKVGYKAVILANDGIERHSVVEEIGKDSAILAVENEVVADRKNATITLYAGLLKNNKLDFVLML